MQTDVDICNIALGRIGVDRTITSLSEASKEARNCRRFYDLCRDEVLERMPWSFAARTAPLARLPDAVLLPNWAYQYAVPVDAVKILEVVPAGSVGEASSYYGDCCEPWAPPRPARNPFRRGVSADGAVAAILSNVPDAYAVYTARVENTAIYSTLFVSMLADRLAMELAMPMTVDPRWFGVAQQRFAASMMEASSRDFEQNTRERDPTAPSILARG